ncbi:hypothetical protein [Dokdonella sp.]|uniref:hypothetical protein n=1 Tax=Dokdonella sp. TaxID=2291710 RepID=UPI003529394A
MHGGWAATRASSYKVEQFYRDNRLVPSMAVPYGIQGLDLLVARLSGVHDGAASGDVRRTRRREPDPRVEGGGACSTMPMRFRRDCSG